MRITYGHKLRDDRQTKEFTGDVINIGRDNDNDIILDHQAIAPHAAALHVKDNQWELIVLGPSDVRIGPRKLRRGDRVVVNGNFNIELYPYSVQIDIPSNLADTAETFRNSQDVKLTTLVAQVHTELLERMEEMTFNTSEHTEREHRLLENNITDIVSSANVLNDKYLMPHSAGLALRCKCIDKILEEESQKSIWDGSNELRNKILTSIPEREVEVAGLVRLMFANMGLSAVSGVEAKIYAVENHFWSHWSKLLIKLHGDVVRYMCISYFRKEIKDIVYGFGPLEDLLRIPFITEIMVVDSESIYIENKGVIQDSGRRFISDKVTLAIIDKIVKKADKSINTSSPYVDARLQDGSRVNAIIHPLAVSGPCLTIRKFSQRKITIAKLIAIGSLSEDAAEFLDASVVAKKNILVSGGTGTGKTTLLNCLSDFIPKHERVVTIEDTAELQLQNAHIVRLEAKSANVQGSGAIGITELVKNSLRMRPDRIIVGECRGPEALDMLQAMNSGHSGSMTTLHSNSAIDAILRLEVLVQRAANMPISSIRRQIASAIDIVVQLQRIGAKRVVSQITEILDVDVNTGNVQCRDLYLYDCRSGKSGISPTGSLPSFIEELIVGGKLNMNVFLHQRAMA